MTTGMIRELPSKRRRRRRGGSVGMLGNKDSFAQPEFSSDMWIYFQTSPDRMAIVENSGI